MCLLPWAEKFEVFPSVDSCRFSTVGSGVKGWVRQVLGVGLPMWRRIPGLGRLETLCLLLGQVFNAF